jgi:rhodanese-related sulfurtransferase
MTAMSGVMGATDSSRRGAALTTPISREDLRAKLANPEPPVLVEALGSAFFADAHLPGAINIPPDQVDRLAPSLLPDLDAEIVVYCSGTCRNSEATARRLEELGYRRVLMYPDGKEDWVEHFLPVERAADRGATVTADEQWRASGSVNDHRELEGEGVHDRTQYASGP